MAWYQFKGNNALGQAVQGCSEAESELALLVRLKSMGITPVNIDQLSLFTSVLISIKRKASRIFRIKKTDLALFYDQLADLLEVNIPIKHALSVMATHLRNPHLVAVIHDLVASLSRGVSFSDALSQYERLFSPVTVRLIGLAQSKEELIAMLRYCDQSMQRATFLKRLFLVAMPQFSLTFVFLVILAFLREHYLPGFKYALFVFRQPPPIIIRVFDVLTSLFTTNILKTVLIVAGMIVVFKMLLRFSKKLRLCYDGLLCYVPIISSIVLTLERERLSLLFSILLKGGSSVQKCTQCSAAIIHNVFFRRRVSAMSAAVHQGESFSSALQYFRIFSVSEIQMIALGSVSNSLEKAFEKIYSVSQVLLERNLVVLIESTRLFLYLLNTALFFFVIFVAETLFYYPGS